MRTFAYCRVSTNDQTTENQVHEIEAAGFKVEPHRIITETISGSTAADQRPSFSKLLERLETGDVLIVTKLDRLGRSALDVRATVDRLAGGGIRVHCLALGGMDLTSAAGRMTMGVISVVAEFEKDLLVERTRSGLSRAKAAGKALGRRPSLNSEQRELALKKRSLGESLGSLAVQCGAVFSAQRIGARGFDAEGEIRN